MEISNGGCKKIFLILVSAFLFLTSAAVFAQENAITGVNVYFFWGDGCPHCEEEKVFFNELKIKYQGIKIYDFEVWRNSHNRQLLSEVGEKLNFNVQGVPFTVVGNKYFSGWREGITDKSIKQVIESYLKTNCPDLVGWILTSEEQGGTASDSCGCEPEQNSSLPQEIKLPIFGQVSLKNISLPILTVIFGALDGFNPCAMWVLLFLITLLLGLKDKKKMLILGSAFIVTSALVYFLFMAAWLNLILFLGFILWIRIIIGLIAIIGGGYSLKEYRDNKEGVCKIAGDEKKQKIIANLKKITQEPKFWLALLGIIVLAFAINLIELVCSAGLPAVYTQILTLNNLSWWQYYGYILVYVFFFMLDDLIVFFVAMATLRIVGMTAKYTRFSHLIGGIIMVIIGLLLIFKPGWLMFG